MADAVAMHATCRRCGGIMRPGKAMGQTVTGLPDFAGDNVAVTVSPGGPGRLLDCLKCEACGHSISVGMLSGGGAA